MHDWEIGQGVEDMVAEAVETPAVVASNSHYRMWQPIRGLPAVSPPAMVAVNRALAGGAVQRQ